jgi:hypothetical protein
MNKHQAKQALRAMMKRDELWHFDDDLDDVFPNCPLNPIREAMIDRLNELWASDSTAINAGAWDALAECCPELFEQVN